MNQPTTPQVGRRWAALPRIPVGLILVGLLCRAGAGCRGGQTITIENDTSTPVVVHAAPGAGPPVLNLPPGQHYTETRGGFSFGSGVKPPDVVFRVDRASGDPLGCLSTGAASQGPVYLRVSQAAPCP